MNNYKMTIIDKIKYKWAYSYIAMWFMSSNWKYLIRELFCKHDWKFAFSFKTGGSAETCKKCGKTKLN